MNIAPVTLSAVKLSAPYQVATCEPSERNGVEEREGTKTVSASLKKLLKPAVQLCVFRLTGSNLDYRINKTEETGLAVTLWLSLRRYSIRIYVIYPD
jgi:hypothetical protein